MAASLKLHEKECKYGIYGKVKKAFAIETKKVFFSK